MTQEALKLALDALENSQDFVVASANAKLKTGWGEQLDKADKAINAIKKALAQPEPCDMGDICIGCSPRNADGSCPSSQPEQEPVAYINVEERKLEWAKPISWNTPTTVKLERIPLYIHSQRTWVGLTDDEMELTFIECGGKWNGDFWKIEDADFHPFLRTIEAKLKERNFA